MSMEINDLSVECFYYNLLLFFVQIKYKWTNGMSITLKLIMIYIKQLYITMHYL
jgi:hypothetical protein